MKKKEIIQELKRYGYSRVNIDTDRRTSKTFYTYRGGIHINGTENLSFHIVPPTGKFRTGTVCHMRYTERGKLTAGNRTCSVLFSAPVLLSKR